MASTILEIDRPSYDRATLRTNRELLMGLIPDLSQDALKARCGDCGASLSWGQWFQRHGVDILTALKGDDSRAHALA